MTQKDESMNMSDSVTRVLLQNSGYCLKQMRSCTYPECDCLEQADAKRKEGEIHEHSTTTPV